MKKLNSRILLAIEKETKRLSIKIYQQLLKFSNVVRILYFIKYYKNTSILLRKYKLKAINKWVKRME